MVDADLVHDAVAHRAIALFRRPVARFAALATGAVAFVLGGLAQSTWVNVDLRTHDQDNYLRYAMEQAESGFTRLGNRAQSPAYPTLLALLDAPGLSMEQLFLRGKLFGVATSLALCFVAAALVWRVLPRLPALVTSLLFSFFVVAFRAAYVQCENLSYVTLFLLFLAAQAFWRRASLGRALALGASLALAWLVKGTALLGWEILASCIFLREAILFFREGRVAERARPIAWLAVSFATFFAAIFPYARHSKEAFGGWLYNLSSTYVIWCDSWEQWVALEARLGRHDTLWRLPAAERAQLPSMGRYLASHGPVDIARREVLGLGEVVGNCLLSHGYAVPVLACAAMAIALLRKHRDLRNALLPADPRATGWFLLAYFGLHVLAFGFYGPIGAGNRFILGLLLPALVSLCEGMAKHARPAHTVTVRGRTLGWDDFLGALLVVLGLQLALYWPVAIATHYSGG